MLLLTAYGAIQILYEVKSMAVSKKSIIKSSSKPTATKTTKSTTASPAAPAGKMVTAMRMAKSAKLAKSVMTTAKSFN
jgi:hypothetical protein